MTVNAHSEEASRLTGFMPVTASFTSQEAENTLTLVCSGAWTIDSISLIDDKLRSFSLAASNNFVMDTSAVTGFDTAGAWLVERSREQVVDNGGTFSHVDINPFHRQLVEVVRGDDAPVSAEVNTKQNIVLAGVDSFGRAAAGMGQDFLTACFLVGSSIRGPQMKAGKRGGIRLTSIIHNIHQMGFRAIPVIAVMSFLIGAIIAQQGAYQLKQFGEELLTVNLVGVLHFREIAVLLTAIMVAGRSGSAITAELGTMKMREEIDALQVMGLNPVGVLIFPRLVALIIALPILTLLSDVSGILGAIVVCDLYIGITPGQFVDALQQGVEPQHFIVGLIKAPVMAIIIGLAAAVEGLKVGGSAESLGQRTTSSVVRAIFAVILMDGLFAIFFATIGY